jgi:hypothetical protein
MAVKYTESMADLFPDLLDCEHEKLSVPVPWISGYSEGNAIYDHWEHTCLDCGKKFKSNYGITSWNHYIRKMEFI